MGFLASATVDPTAAFTAGPGISWWQTAGCLVFVFWLLVISLKLLGRFQRRAVQGQAAVLTVWNLGPRREIQVVRLEDQVHYIYRHDGAMVLLKQLPLSQWKEQAADPGAAQPGLGAMLGRLMPGSRPLQRGRTCDLEA